MRVSKKAATGALVVSTLLAGPVAMAHADPSPQLPNSSPQTPNISPQTPSAPAPTPAPGPSIIPAPTYDAPPVYEGTSSYTPPVYSGAYNPVPPALRAPRPVKPVNPILPRPGVIKLGNFHTPQPAWLSDADARNLNGQAATLEARTATYYESIGFPPDQAARTAASTTVGALVGGTAGAVVGAVPGAVAGALIGLPAGAAVGAITGAIVGTVPGSIVPGAGTAAGAAAGAGPGALIGLAAGPVVGGLAGGAGGAALGALGGGLLGGAIGYAVGAGDPGGDPNAPLAPTTENPRLSRPTPPHPEANQYEAHLNNAGLPGGGSVDYVVTKSGDVNATAKLGATSVPLHITAAQADAPFKAAGALAQTARDTVANTVNDIGRQAEKLIPGLTITHPQFEAPRTGKHAR